MDGPAVPALLERLGLRRKPVTRRVFRDAYAEHFTFVWRSLVRLGVPVDEAEDAVQEVFVVAYRRWDEFEARSSVRTWLFAIARRVASHDRRTRQRRSRRTRAFGDVLEDAIDGEAAAEKRHAAAQLQAFLDALEPSKREVFILADLEGFTGREVASTLGIKPNTAWSRLKAARAEFAKQFGGSVRKRPAVIVDAAAPPVEARARVWAVMVPQLGFATKAAGASAGVLQTWMVAFNVKMFGATVGVGLGTVAAVHVATMEPPAVQQPSTPKVASAKKSAPVQRPKAVRARTVETAAQGPVVAPPVDDHAPPGLVRAPPPAEAVPLQRPASLDASRSKEPAAREPTPKPDTDANGVLVRARKALQSGDAHGALMLIEEHARRFPKSLEKMRAILRIEALCAAGKKAQGIGEASAFFKSGGDVHLKARVQRACGLKSERAAAADPPGSAVAVLK
jgi:RNA polymerase sigma-70 factor (ECF subfamily)